RTSPVCSAHVRPVPGRPAPRAVLFLLCRALMMAFPPGPAVTATGYGRSASWLVTVRPAMMPTVEPNTASLSQCRFAGRREMATYEENPYPGIEYFQLGCRSSAVATANVSAA